MALWQELPAAIGPVRLGRASNPIGVMWSSQSLLRPLTTRFAFVMAAPVTSSRCSCTVL